MNATPEIICTTTLEYDVTFGYRIDGNKVQFWGTRERAKAGAKAIGWPVKSLTKVWTRFQCGWALSQEHGGLLARESYESLLRGKTHTPGQHVEIRGS